MATVGSVEYIVVEGLLTDMAAFSAAVAAQVDLGFHAVDEPQTDGTDIWQMMMRGSPASFITEYEIDDVDQGTDEFEIVGDESLHFQAGFKFTVTRSDAGANDGVYTVAPGGATFSTPNTIIPVVEEIPGATVSGYIEMWSPSVGP